MAATDSATRRGSSASSGSGLPVAIWQKSHRRVHWSPPIRKVASRSSQHSKMFGQPASSHTVCSPSRRTSCLSSVYSGPVRSRVLIHGGLRSIGTWLLRASRRSRRRPSGASTTPSSVLRLAARPGPGGRAVVSAGLQAGAQPIQRQRSGCREGLPQRRGRLSNVYARRGRAVGTATTKWRRLPRGQISDEHRVWLAGSGWRTDPGWRAGHRCRRLRTAPSSRGGTSSRVVPGYGRHWAPYGSPAPSAARRTASPALPPPWPPGPAGTGRAARASTPRRARRPRRALIMAAGVTAVALAAGGTAWATVGAAGGALSTPRSPARLIPAWWTSPRRWASSTPPPRAPAWC